MGKLARVRIVEPPPQTEEQILARLDQWRERLAETKGGTVNCILSLTEVRGAIDRLLDELLLFINARELNG